MWADIEKAVSDASDTPFKIESRHEISGGCINRAVCLKGLDRTYFAKLNSASQLAMFASEVIGLHAISATRTLRAPNPIAWGTTADQSWLILEYIPMAQPCIATDALLGEQLAARHGASRALLEKGRRLLLRLPDLLDGYHPEASLLHGDLWSGNRAADDQGQPVILDAAVYYGDREADLAMTELFGGGYAQQAEDSIDFLLTQ